jgi:hypothetical protein
MDLSDKPSPRAVATAERELLLGRVERLQDLKRRAVEAAGCDLRGQKCAEAVEVAVEQLQAAIDTFELASHE